MRHLYDRDEPDTDELAPRCHDIVQRTFEGRGWHLYRRGVQSMRRPEALDDSAQV